MTPHQPGDPMPVHPSKLVTVQYRNGRIVGPIRAGAIAWGKLKHESGSDVVGYADAENWTAQDELDRSKHRAGIL